jgi:hypothetical protein
VGDALALMSAQAIACRIVAGYGSRQQRDRLVPR